MDIHLRAFESWILNNPLHKWRMDASPHRSLQYVASRMKVTRETIRNWECGNTDVQMKNIKKLGRIVSDESFVAKWSAWLEERPE